MADFQVVDLPKDLPKDLPEDLPEDLLATTLRALPVDDSDDSGVSVGHSRTSSESSDWSEHSVIPSDLFPSLGTLDVNFNIWSPSGEDDLILSRQICEPSFSRSTSMSSTSGGEAESDTFSALLDLDVNFNPWSPSGDDDSSLIGQVSEPSCSRSTSASSSSDSEAGSDTTESLSIPSVRLSDLYDWGVFCEWEPVPTLEEAAILLAQQLREEEAIHARAAAKRAAKKEKFFAKLFAKKSRRL